MKTPTAKQVKRMNDQEKMTAFAKEMAALTMKYGIGVESCGSVYWENTDTLKSVEYTDDPTSGDISYHATHK